MRGARNDEIYSFFLKLSTIIVITIKPWWKSYEHFKVIVFKDFTIVFLYYVKHASCIQGCFKKADI